MELKLQGNQITCHVPAMPMRGGCLGKVLVFLVWEGDLYHLPLGLPCGCRCGCHAAMRGLWGLGPGLVSTRSKEGRHRGDKSG